MRKESFLSTSLVFLLGLIFPVSICGDAAKKPVPIPKTGVCPDELAPFDNLMLRFLEENEVPGASLAVLKDHRLLVARGYGWADKNRNISVKPDSLFRLASVSKPITAVAILQLVETGKLRLSDKAFDLLRGKFPPAEGEPKDARWKDITVLQLLQHRAGFDRGKSFDPMFRSVEFAKALGIDPPASAGDVIRYMYRIPLDFTPGTAYVYSNFGYNLLGRIIEVKTGQSYEDYVRDRVFKPIGVTSARIGKTKVSDRHPDEVSYYVRGDPRTPSVLDKARPKVPYPYGGWYLEAMDSHGGWIASSVDLARFLAAFQRLDKCQLLKAASIATMWRRPDAADIQGKPAFYGCGWLVRPRWFASFNAWHNGKLAGTATIMVRRHDGLCWTVLLNTDENSKGQYLSTLIDPLLHRAAAEVKNWPKRDLFALYK